MSILKEIGRAAGKAFDRVLSRRSPESPWLSTRPEMPENWSSELTDIFAGAYATAGNYLRILPKELTDWQERAAVGDMLIQILADRQIYQMRTQQSADFQDKVSAYCRQLLEQHLLVNYDNGLLLEAETEDLDKYRESARQAATFVLGIAEGEDSTNVLSDGLKWLTADMAIIRGRFRLTDRSFFPNKPIT